MTGLRTRLGRTIGRAGAGVVARDGCRPARGRRLPRRPRTPMPTPRSPRRGTRAADPRVRSGRRTAGSTRRAAASGRTSPAARSSSRRTPVPTPCVARSWTSTETLGGPADGDLGFPTIDEGDGKAPGSRNTTFSAADRPVIFWTPDNGAHVVRGAINAAWDKLGGSAGALGVPTDDETYDGDQVSQTFSGGQVTWNRKTNAFTTTPPDLADQLAGLEIPGDVTTAIDAARRAAGGPLGPLGATDGGQYAIGSRRHRAELRGRQDLLQPRHRGQRADRPGPGQVRERGRSAGRPRIPDQQRERRRAGADEQDRDLRRRRSAGDLLDARLRRRDRARGDERGVGQARRGDRSARRPHGRPDRRTATSSRRSSTAARSPGTRRPMRSPPSRRTCSPNSPGSRCQVATCPSRTPPAAAVRMPTRPGHVSWWWLLAVIPLVRGRRGGDGRGVEAPPHAATRPGMTTTTTTIRPPRR